MNLNFEQPQNFWSFFSKYIPRPSDITGGHEDPTHFTKKIEYMESVSDEFDEVYPKLEAEVIDSITSISTYHACKVIDEASYRQKGIRRLRKGEAVTWMKDFFQLSEEVDSAVSQLEASLPHYCECNASGVYTTCSMSEGIERG